MPETSTLIISYPADEHARQVALAIESRDHVCQIVNLGEYPSGFESALLLGLPSHDVAEFIFQNVRSPISGIWWRRPRGAYRDMPNPLATYIEAESQSYVRALTYFLRDAVWVSDPSATRSAEVKPYQLAQAQEFGWRIPATFAGNSRDGMLRFLNLMGDRPLVAKAIGSGFVRLNASSIDDVGLNRAIYSKRVSREFVREHLNNVPACPFFLQEEIAKDFDVRVTVVGQQVFAVSIKGPRHQDEIDWRHPSRERQYESHQLPSAVSGLCARTVKGLGLNFGCLDLAYSDSEGYTFFELNPQGQWLPSNRIFSGGITAALVDLLTGHLA